MNEILKEHTNTMQTTSITESLEERVDLRTGRLVFDYTDFDWEGNLFPVSIHHVYNSALSARQYTGGDDLVVADFSAMKLGYGWKLNIMQSMVERDGKCYYTDGEGNTIEFIKDTDSEIYHSADDSSVTYSNGILTMGAYEYKFEQCRLVEIKRKNSADSSPRMLITYSNGRITKVTDGAGREFTFGYTNDGYLLSIIAPNNTSMEFSYGDYGDDECLSMILFKTDDFTLESKCGFIHDHETGELTDLAIFDPDGNEQMTKEYEYVSSAFSCSTETFYDEVLNEIDGKSISFEYSNNCTEVTVSTIDNGIEESVTTTYVFDSDNEVISEYVTLSSGEKYEISTNCHPAEPFSATAYAVGLYNGNFIKNSSFATTDSWMDEEESPITLDDICSDESYAMYGRNSLILTSNDRAANERGFLQALSLEKGDYTFSAYVRVKDAFEYDEDFENLTPGVYLTASCAGESFDISEVISERSTGFVRISTSFTLNENTDEVYLQIFANGSGTAYVSAPMLEKGNTVGEYNFIEVIDDELSGWTKSGYEDFINYDGTVGFEQKGSIRLEGKSSVPMRIRKNIKPKMSKNLFETYVFSAWGMAKQLSNGSGANTPTFRIRAVIHYADGTSEEFTKDFVNVLDVWQKAELEFEKTYNKEVDSIDLYCDYDYQGNSYNAYFDDMSIYRVDVNTKSELAEDSVVSDYKDSDDTNSEFKEARDTFGNTLTETVFSDGCFGTFYRSFAYSENGNDKISETDTRGNIVNYTVDPVTSRVTSVTDRVGNKTEYTYDFNGKVSKVVFKDADGNVCSEIEYTYDYNGNLTCIERGDGKLYSFAYNNMGLLTDAVGMVTYDYKKSSGRLKSMTYANGSTVNITYDKLGKIIRETWTKGSSVEADYRYSYDKDGNVISTIDFIGEKEYNYHYRDGNVVRMSVNKITLTGETVTSRTSAYSVRYTYTSDGQIYKKEYPSSGLKVYYRYPDNADAVIKYLYGNTIAEFHSETDSLGRRISEEIRTGKSVHYRKFEYLQGEITPTHTNEGKVVSRPETSLVKRITFSDRVINYTYDEEDRIITYADNKDAEYEYEYDAQGQVIRENRSGTITLYEYDAYGNVTAKGRTTSSDGKLDTSSPLNTLYQYDTGDPDKLISYTVPGSNGPVTYNFAYDELGNPTTHKSLSVEWTKGRMLKKYGKHHFEYNESGIRTARYFNTTVDGERVTVRYDYELEGTKVVRMLYRDRNGVENILIPLYDTADSPIGIIYNNERYWFAKNLQGDILSIYNDSGEEVVRYRYNAWGVPSVKVDSSGISLAVINPFRYRGYLYDNEYSLYYLQSRYYDPEIGRFISPEPNIDEGGFDLSAKALAYNTFTYCANNPIVYKDDTGEGLILACVTAFAIIGAAVGAIGGSHYAKHKKGLSPNDGWSYWKYVVGGGVAGGALGGVVGWAFAGTPVAASISWRVYAATHTVGTSSYAIGHFLERWYYDAYNVVYRQVSYGGCRFDAIFKNSIVELKNYDWSKYKYIKSVMRQLLSQADKYTKFVGTEINGVFIKGVTYCFSYKPPQAIIKALEAKGITVNYLK